MLANVAERLRGGAIERAPPFDPRALPSYILIAVGAALTLAFVVIGGFRFSSPWLLVPPTWSTGLIFAGLLARRYGHPKIGGATESVGLLYSQSLVILGCLPMLTAISGPLADNVLAKADHMLGFDWLSFVMLFRDSPRLLRVASTIYMTFLAQPALILITLFALSEDDRAWRFVSAGAISLFLTLAIYPFLPSEGAFIHFGVTPKMYPNLHTASPWSFAPAIHALRGGMRLIGPGEMVGYISFPSYHTASAVLFTWAMWPSRKLRCFVLALNVAMVVAAVIIGAHYLVDLLGGAVVAFGSIVIAKAVGRRYGVTTTMPEYAPVVLLSDFELQ